MGLTTFGLYGIALDGHCLFCFIDCMVLGWVELLDLMVTLDCVGYALSGLDLIDLIGWLDCSGMIDVIALLVWTG